MVNLTIDGKQITVKENTTIMEQLPEWDSDSTSMLSERNQ